jgi:hypothetical protein
VGRTRARNPNAQRICPSKAPTAKSLSVLRYVREYMDPTFAWEVLCATARAFADHARTSKSRHEETKAQMVLYLKRNLGHPLLHSPRALAASRWKQRVAFAGALFSCFRRLLARSPPHALCQCDGRDPLPSELGMHIASEAQLVPPDVVVKAAGSGAVVQAGR